MGHILLKVVFLAACLIVATSQTLVDLTEEQIKGAIAELSERDLLEIITSAGYKVDEVQEPPSREELVEAAQAITLDQKELMLRAEAEVETPEEYVKESMSTPSADVQTEQEIEYDDLDDAPPQAELARKHGLRDDAGFWELFQAQVMSDLGPFIRAVPPPVKAFIVDQARNFRPVVVGAVGAAGPMLGALSKVIRVAGHGLVAVSEKLEEIGEQVKRRHVGEEEEEERTVNGGA